MGSLDVRSACLKPVPSVCQALRSLPLDPIPKVSRLTVSRAQSSSAPDGRIMRDDAGPFYDFRVVFSDYPRNVA